MTLLPLTGGSGPYSRAFPLDYFGVVASPLIQALTEQSSNRRARKSALGRLTQMAKATKQLPKQAVVQSVGLTTDKAGQLTLTFYFTMSATPKLEVPANAR